MKNLTLFWDLLSLRPYLDNYILFLCVHLGAMVGMEENRLM